MVSIPKVVMKGPGAAPKENRELRKEFSVDERLSRGIIGDGHPITAPVER